MTIYSGSTRVRVSIRKLWIRAAWDKLSIPVFSTWT